MRAWDRLVARAAEQHGYVTTRDARELDIDPAQLRLMAARGRLERAGRGAGKRATTGSRFPTVPRVIDALQTKPAEDDATFEGSAVRGRHSISELGLIQFSPRYIYHLLARLTAYVDVAAGRPDGCPTYIDRGGADPLDIEHMWAWDPSRFADEFPDTRSFEEARNDIGGLLLLPADVNRSYQDKAYEDKVAQYAKQNFWAASLHASAHEHQPQCTSFIAREGLPVKAYEHVGKAEQQGRNALVLDVANKIWSPWKLEVFR
jgi:hypothetical protein